MPHTSSSAGFIKILRRMRRRRTCARLHLTIIKSIGARNLKRTLDVEVLNSVKRRDEINRK
jgi:hypothetical protein